MYLFHTQMEFIHFHSAFQKRSQPTLTQSLRDTGNYLSGVRTLRSKGLDSTNVPPRPTFETLIYRMSKNGGNRTAFCKNHSCQEARFWSFQRNECLITLVNKTSRGF